MRTTEPSRSENNWYVKSPRLGGDEILEKGLQLEKGGSGGRLEVVVSSASAQLEGSVSDHDGSVIGAHVRIAPEPETAYNRSHLHSVRTDQSGHFFLAGLAPGTYRVLANYSASPGSVSWCGIPVLTSEGVCFVLPLLRSTSHQESSIEVIAQLASSARKINLSGTTDLLGLG